MKTPLSLLALTLFLASGGAQAHSGEPHEKSSAAAKVQERQPWGVAGDAARVRRTITIRMSDAMRFVPDEIRVKRGETVRFQLHNDGGLLHEMVIGTQAVLEEHAALMKKVPEMEHDEPWMAHVPPGGRGEIIWQFDRAGKFGFACLIPGHYEAGMVGKIVVRP